MKKTFLWIFLVFVIFFALSISARKPENKILSQTKVQADTTMVADKLEVPWALDFLPDHSILFTERPGRVRQITSGGVLLEKPIYIVRDVKATGEGGLLGIAIDPQFSKNHFIYLYYTYKETSGNTLNKVVRYVYANNALTDSMVIVPNIPGNLFHNGGRLKFGPDGYLYITTGDSQQPSFAQDKNKIAGKILRVSNDGKPAPGNPFKNLVYSYGHRNPQGLAWDESGNLWEAEHGSSAKDEINKIMIGENYGWPTITGSTQKMGMMTPIINSGKNTWAPSGLVYLNPYLYFAGLRGNALFRYNTKNKELKEYLNGVYGRLRDVVLGPDGFLYITTSNMDGRALTHLNGDKIIRIDPNSF